jgi:outer membrane DcaP-like protein
VNRLVRSVILLAIVACVVVVVPAARAEGGSYNFYGFVMTDAGYNGIGIDPQWFDVQRPTKLPSVKNEFGEDGSVFFSSRQTRFGLKTVEPTSLGDIKAIFEWELFGVGVDAGQTTIRLRHAYGELGKWGVGQTWSPFMDIDVFPNTLEYWGPNGMAFFRNVQFRYMPIQGDTRMTIAFERPGASADAGDYASRVDLTGVTARFPMPDISAEYRKAIANGGYFEGAGIVRQIKWQDNTPTPTDISGNVLGWGVSLSSNLKGAGNVLRLQFVYGEGVENYMNDAPADVGVKPGTNPARPVEGEALPVTGAVAFLDHNWSDKWSSSVGYSMVDIKNSAGQLPDAFKNGQYALVNILNTPVPNFMMGVEGGWIHRENNSDGFKVDDYHVQVSAKYSFSFSSKQD